MYARKIAHLYSATSLILFFSFVVTTALFLKSDMVYPRLTATLIAVEGVSWLLASLTAIYWIVIKANLDTRSHMEPGKEKPKS